MDEHMNTSIYPYIRACTHRLSRSLTHSLLLTRKSTRDASERNVKIYERFGYKVQERCTVSVQHDEPGSHPFTDVFVMFRPPSSSFLMKS